MKYRVIKPGTCEHSNAYRSGSVYNASDNLNNAHYNLAFLRHNYSADKTKCKDCDWYIEVKEG